MPSRTAFGVAVLLSLGACGDMSTTPGTDRPAAAAVVDLVTLVAETGGTMPGRDSDGYVPPTPAEEKAFLGAVDRALAGDVAGADATLDAHGYDCQVVIEAVTGDSLVVFRERAPVRRGWGTFVWNRTGALPVDVHVNHPVHDEHSEVIGAALYRRLRGRWLLVAGTHRYANRAGNSDMAREPGSLFQKLFEHVGPGARQAVSLHGFAGSAHTEPVASTQVILSGGRSGQGVPVAALSAVDLRGRLLGAAFRTGLYSVDPGLDAFAGSLNPQGHFANEHLGGARWIHVELEREVRVDALRWAALNDRIGEWASATFGPGS